MMFFFTLLALITCLHLAGAVTPPCDMPFQDRQDAYDDSWDLGECEQRGFCWNEGPEEVPWCYHPREMEGYATSEECSAASAAGNRRECAVEDEEINPHSCTSRGCCWAPGTAEGDAWCFYPAGAGEEAQRDEM